MSRIQVLPEILANKIAAGEIVERPASVVKELVENALDAGSRHVRVAVLGGGRRSILVCDDGEGMTEDDALLAFEHHATSKLRRAEDLSAIATLGFRGEALPSIASVSRLRLRTRAADAAAPGGTEIQVHGGVLRNVKTIAWERGTEIEVGGLFYNLPARKKFLRSQETELGHVARLVTHYALAHPEVRFELQSDGRELLRAVGAADMLGAGGPDLRGGITGTAAGLRARIGTDAGARLHLSPLGAEDQRLFPVCFREPAHGA